MDRILIRRIARKASVALIALAAASALLEWKRLPLSILIGGALGLANIRGLAWGIRGLVGTEKATAKMVFFSQFRLFLLFLVSALLIYTGLVSILGMLAGFSVVFVFTLIEGYRLSQRPPDIDPE